MILKNRPNQFFVFILILVVLFWMMPSNKIETIGDFFYKIIAPLSLPLSILLISQMGIGIFGRKK
jgi:uncharacterized protein YggT (Ycf19 family)